MIVKMMNLTMPNTSLESNCRTMMGLSWLIPRKSRRKICITEEDLTDEADTREVATMSEAEVLEENITATEAEGKEVEEEVEAEGKSKRTKERSTEIVASKVDSTEEEEM